MKYVLVILWLHYSIQALQAEDAETVFASEYLDKYTASNLPASINYDSVSRSTIPSGEQVTTRSKGIIAGNSYSQQQGQLKTQPDEAETLDSIHYTLLECRNSKYEFILKRNIDSTKDDYAVISCTIHSDSSKRYPMLMYTAPYLDPLLGEQYFDLLSSDKVNIKEIRFLNEQERRYITVEVTHNLPKYSTFAHKSVYCFDRQNHWACIELRHYTDLKDANAYLLVECKYQHDERYAKLSELSYSRPSTNGVAKFYTIKFLNYESADDVDQRMFRLSFYGFPEPVGITWDQPISKLFWILTSFSALALFAFLFTRLARRARRKAAMPPT